MVMVMVVVMVVAMAMETTRGRVRAVQVQVQVHLSVLFHCEGFNPRWGVSGVWKGKEGEGTGEGKVWRVRFQDFDPVHPLNHRGILTTQTLRL